MKRTIAVVTSSRADYSHLYWPLHDLAQHPDVELKLIVALDEIVDDGRTARRGAVEFVKVVAAAARGSVVDPG